MKLHETSHFFFRTIQRFFDSYILWYLAGHRLFHDISLCIFCCCFGTTFTLFSFFVYSVRALWVFALFSVYFFSFAVGKQVLTLKRGVSGSSTMVLVSTVQPSKVSMWLHGSTRVFSSFSYSFMYNSCRYFWGLDSTDRDHCDSPPCNVSYECP